MKIAFLVPTKVQSNHSGVHVIKDITCLLNSLPNIYVTVFSIGKKDENIKLKNYKEIVSKNNGFIGNNNILIKLLDYFSLLLLKRSYSYFIRNTCSTLIGKLADYDPDIIITSYEFSDFITHYKRHNKKIKIMALMDDPRQLNDAINSKLALIKNKTFLCKIYKFEVKFIAHNYLQMLKEKYDGLVKNAIFIINFTIEGNEISKKIYKKYSSKFLVIPPPLTNFNIKSTHKLKVKRHARNILFLGSCNYSPNKEAIQLIENNIAPKLPEFNFILVGKNCKKYKFGNIKSFGYIAHINKILDKSDICIAPIIHGGGIKTKLLDYIVACKPIIGTSLAFEGYPIKDGINAVIEDDIDRYAERIRLLAKSYRLRKEITKNTLKIIPYFSNDKLIKRWTTLFNKAMLIT